MKHGLVDRRIADSVLGGRRVWVYTVPEWSVRAGTVEVVGYSVGLGVWVMVVLVGDSLLFNGFTMKRNDEDEVREFMRKVNRGF